MYFFRRQLSFFIFYLYFIIFLESNLLLPLSLSFFLFPLILISFCPFLVSSPFLLLPSLFSSFVIPPRLQRSKSFPSVKVSLFTVSRVHGHTFAHYIFLHSFLPRLLLPLIQCIYSTHSPSSYSARIPLLFPLISSLFLNKKLLWDIFTTCVPVTHSILSFLFTETLFLPFFLSQNPFYFLFQFIFLLFLSTYLSVPVPILFLT